MKAIVWGPTVRRSLLAPTAIAERSGNRPSQRVLWNSNLEIFWSTPSFLTSTEQMPLEALAGRAPSRGRSMPSHINCSPTFGRGNTFYPTQNHLNHLLFEGTRGIKTGFLQHLLIQLLKMGLKNVLLVGKEPLNLAQSHRICVHDTFKGKGPPARVLDRLQAPLYNAFFWLHHFSGC